MGVLAKNHDRRLADLLGRIFISSRPSDGETNSYHELVAGRLLHNTSTRVDVQSRAFVHSLGRLSSQDLLLWLGIQWKRNTSVKDIDRRERDQWNWDDLPNLASWIISALSEESSLLLTASYNKLKHGPQMVIMSVRNAAIKKRALPADEVLGITPDVEYVRLLLRGARTQEEPGELERGVRVAPFLLHDAYFIDKVLYDIMLHLAMSVNRLGYWVLRAVLKRKPSVAVDPIIESIRAYARRRKQASP